MKLKKYKISFCIVCMNRLHQLKETLLQNISDNADYDELEYIVLDYNSQDGMEEWAKEHLMEYITAGRVIYYRTPQPQTFSHSHSKNTAFKLAGGDIVCSINADHFTGKGFATYVNKAFNDNENSVLTTIDFYRTKKDYFPKADVFGKVCVRKSDFIKVRGFDESMEGYGFEDYDFVNRLELSGVKRVLIEDFSFLNFISHGKEERYSLDARTSPENIYLSYQEPFASDLIMLYRDGRFKSGVLIDNDSMYADYQCYAYRPKTHRYQITIQDPGWQEGQWKLSQDEQCIYFHSNNSAATLKLRQHTIDTYKVLEDESDNKLYYELTDFQNIKKIESFNYFFHNRSIMEKNLKNRIIEVNNTGFGESTLFKNFNYPFSI